MQDKEQLGVADLLSEANASMPRGAGFARAEIMAALQVLDEQNKVMLHDQTVHKV